MNSVFAGSGFSFPLGVKTYICGILNLTPDSFSDGGRYNNVDAALRHAEKMAEDGADIIDIGAVSTRPFSSAVSVETELERLMPALSAIISNTSLPVSVDTFNPAVALAALKAGARIINDVSGCVCNEMAAVVREYGAGWIIMHSRGNASDEGDYPGGVVGAVSDFFTDAVSKAEGFGISRHQLCLDPGFGFSKNTDENIQLLNGFRLLSGTGCASMAALSRKRFIGEISGVVEADLRDEATHAADIIAVINGADIVRVHDVAGAARTLKAVDAVIRPAVSFVNSNGKDI